MIVSYRNCYWRNDWKQAGAWIFDYLFQPDFPAYYHDYGYCNSVRNCHSFIWSNLTFTEILFQKTSVMACLEKNTASGKIAGSGHYSICVFFYMEIQIASRRIDFPAPFSLEISVDSSLLKSQSRVSSLADSSLVKPETYFYFFFHRLFSAALFIFFTTTTGTRVISSYFLLNLRSLYIF